MCASSYVRDERLESLTFSNGWIQKTQKRHGLKSKRVHGEAASARAEDVETRRAAHRQITSQYSPKDVFNMDRSAYFYCAMPTTTVSKSSITGRKKIKKRMTIAITANADGSSKQPLLFVGSAARPRCFGKNSASELGVEYTSSAKGWMTTNLFRAWLDQFNAKMCEEGRHVLLLLDNASPHRVSDTFSNVVPHFLPPNTTEHLQPQDAGIIQAFKSQLAKRRNALIVDELDILIDSEECGGVVEVEAERLFNLTVLEAMKLAQEAWEAVTSTTVANCWRHTGILEEDMYELVCGMEKLRLAPLTIKALSG